MFQSLTKATECFAYICQFYNVSWLMHPMTCCVTLNGQKFWSMVGGKTKQTNTKANNPTVCPPCTRTTSYIAESRGLHLLVITCCLIWNSTQNLRVRHITNNQTNKQIKSTCIFWLWKMHPLTNKQTLELHYTYHSYALTKSGPNKLFGASVFAKSVF